MADVTTLSRDLMSFYLSILNICGDFQVFGCPRFLESLLPLVCGLACAAVAFQGVSSG